MKIPQTISDEAKRFYADARPHEPWSLDDIEQLRAEHDGQADVNGPIIEAHVESIQEVDLGGVRTLIVTPRDYNAGNDDRATVFFFGGAYVVGSPYADLPIIARLASRLGIRIYAPFYRRAPEHPCPAAIDDGFAIYRLLLASFPADRLVVAGKSAGGNLALSVVLRARQLGVPVPAAIALISPWCDLTASGESQRQPAGFDPTMDYRCHLREPAAAYAGDYDGKDPVVSPLYADFDRDFPPTLITTGTREGFLSDAARLSVKMRQAGIDVRLHVWEGMWHSFEWYHDIPEADLSLDEIAAFLGAKHRRSDFVYL